MSLCGKYHCKCTGRVTTKSQSAPTEEERIHARNELTNWREMLQKYDLSTLVRLGYSPDQTLCSCTSASKHLRTQHASQHVHTLSLKQRAFEIWCVVAQRFMKIRVSLLKPLKQAEHLLIGKINYRLLCVRALFATQCQT